MRGGNLTNETAPTVGVRFENIVWNFGKVNQPGKAFLEYLQSTGTNIYLVTLLDERKVMAWCYKWNLPYQRVLAADSTLEIPELCVAHHMLSYYDTDDRILEAVSARGNPQTQTTKWEQPLGLS